MSAHPAHSHSVPRPRCRSTVLPHNARCSTSVRLMPGIEYQCPGCRDNEEQMENFQNSQWRVNDDFIVPVADDIDYHVPRARVFEVTTFHSPDPLYDWLPHMAEKRWVDIEAFINAFQHVLQLEATKTGTVIDADMLSRSIVKARELAAS